MGEFKGSTIIFLRDCFKEEGQDLEEQFLASLTPEEKTVYRDALVFSWVPAEIMVSLYRKAAALVYPSNPNGLCELNKRAARHDLSGIYKVLLRFANIPSVINQTASIWKTYCNMGEVHSEKEPNQNKMYFIMTGYPNLPIDCLETVKGYIEGLIGHTGSKNIAVRSDPSNPNSWKWIVTWG